MKAWKSRWKWLVVSMILLVLSMPVWADTDPSPTPYQMDAVVVSTTRNEIPVFDSAQNVTVLNSEDIEASPFERLEDIVRSIPGMYNFRHYGLQTNGIVSPLEMRGVGNNRVLLLVDGVPQNDNFNNSIAWVGWGHIPKETIERIEIVRGPGSALYGSEGLGGIIHIITKKPSAQRKTSIRAEAGSAQTYAGYGFHSQKFNDFGVLVNGGYETSNGFYMVENPKSYEIERYRDMGKLLGKVSYDIDPSSDLTVSALYYDLDAGQGRTYFHNDLELDQYWTTFRKKYDTFALKALAYLNRSDKTAYQDNASNNYASLDHTEKFHGTYTWGADVQGTLTPFKFMPFTVGAAFKEANLNYDEDYMSSLRDAGAKGVQRFVSPFMNLDVHLFEKRLILNAGARYDWIETSDGENWDTASSGGKPPYANHYDSNTNESFSPKAGLAYHPDDRTTLRVSGGKGFRAPSLFELYKVHVRGGGTYYRYANPNLSPEKIWSYDIGGERLLTDKLLGKVSFYQSFASDYIGDRLLRTTKIAGGKTRYEYKLDNISKVKIHGIEAELQYALRNDLSAFANYTYNISEIDEDLNNQKLEGHYLPNDPRHKVHGGFRYQHPDIANVSVIGNYYNDIYYDNENMLNTGDYWTVDLAISKMFLKQYTLYFNIENLFDKEYPIFLSSSSGDTIAPGIIVTAGLKIEF